VSESSRYRSLVPYPRIDRMAMAVSVPIGLSALAFLWAVDFMLAQLADLPFLRDGFPISDLEIAINHARMTGIGRTIAALVVAGGVLWLIWQFQAHANARTLEPDARFAPWAGVLSWLVPVVNAVLPLLAIRDAWRAADPDVAPVLTDERPRRRWTSGWVWARWLTFATAAGLAITGFAQAPRSNATAEQLIARNHWLIPACLVGMVAAVLAIVVVHSLGGRLQRKEGQARFPGWEAWTTSRRRSDGPVSRD
jgi:hypothetical protein